MEPNPLEQTLVLIKPDALKLSLTGYILSVFSEFHTGLRFAGAKIVHVSRMLAEEHYEEHRGKKFYAALIDYLMGKVHWPTGPQRRRVVALVYCGPGAVQKLRDIAGVTNPHKAREEKPGTIRALGTVVPIMDGDRVVAERLDNLVHASANLADAEREIKLWFRPNDIMPYMRDYPTQVCNEHYYFRDGELFTTHVPGSTCLLAPGDVAWTSDLEALRQHLAHQPAKCTLAAVAAKYLINQEPEAE